MSKRYQYFYLIEIQYLGFRLHGWQYQKGLKTVQGFLELTVNFVLENKAFKIMGAGRTDAKVSALSSYFELFLEEPVDEKAFFEALSYNLPADLRILSWRTVDKHFNILQNVKLKEYNYFFAFGERQHPFSAPFIACLQDELDLSLMKTAAKLFEGEHDFAHFCHKPGKDKDTIRSVFSSEILKNDELIANFFPESSFIFKVTGKGFMRYQVRLMMGALFLIGKGAISTDMLLRSLEGDTSLFERFSAPASGLMVKNVDFEL